jgi:hypothetical protein
MKPHTPCKRSRSRHNQGILILSMFLLVELFVILGLYLVGGLVISVCVVHVCASSLSVLPYSPILQLAVSRARDRCKHFLYPILT